MKKSLYLISFAVGALVGSAASYFALKKRFEKITQEEIDSVKETFTYKQGETIAEKTETHSDEDKKDDMVSYSKILKMNNYSRDTVDEENPPSHIEIISPVDLGEFQHYVVVGLRYYADGVLADEEGTVVNIEETVSSYALTQFGEYEDGAVHVRNTKREIDYEVLLDERDYSEVGK